MQLDEERLSFALSTLREGHLARIEEGLNILVVNDSYFGRLASVTLAAQGPV